jgi:hypothetical protein
MDAYRIYRLDPDGRVREPAITLECGADHEAIEAARELAGPDALAIVKGEQQLHLIEAAE